MQKLQKLKQYKRLTETYGFEPVTTTTTELAGVLICSERHTRNLLKQWHEAGWIRWTSRPGRGQKSGLQCLVQPEGMSDELLQELLLKGDYQSALKLAEGNTGYLSQIISPFFGGKWFRSQSVLRIPFYRQLGAVIPALAAGRAERHVINHVYAGLSTFVTGSDEPHPDMAHHWTSDRQHQVWHFFLRSGLYWHNEQQILQEDVLQAVQNALSRPGARALLPDVASVAFTAPWRLTFTLRRGDPLLPHRLAHRLFKLAHPQEERLGCGAFRLSAQNTQLVRLERHMFYHGMLPVVQTVEFWCPPEGRDDSGYRRTVQINVGTRAGGGTVVESTRIQGKGFTFLAFNVHSREMTLTVRQWLLSLVRHLAGRMTEENADMQPSAYSRHVSAPDVLPPAPVLPRRLSLVCYDTAELTLLSRQLTLALAAKGCELTVSVRNVMEWYADGAVHNEDLCLADFLFNDAPLLSVEEGFRTIPFWQAFLPETVLSALDACRYAPESDYTQYKMGMQMITDRLQDESLMTPLFSYHYHVNSLSNVHGVHFTVHGWPDFTRLWIGDEGTDDIKKRR